MAASTGNEDQLQAFRDPYTSGTVHIPARIDKTGRHIILLSDVQSIFESAKCIMIGDKLVPFLVDDNFEIIHPKRIAYHPGMILDLVVGITEQVVRIPSETPPQVTQATSSGYAETSSGREYPAESSSSAAGRLHRHPSNTACTAFPQQFENISAAIANAMNKSIDSYTTALIAETQRHLQQMIQPAIQSLGGVNFSDQLLQSITENARSSIQNNIHPNSNPLSVELFQVLRKIQQDQQLVINNQVTLRQDIQAVFRQTFELLEYSTPRLFIVLPKPIRKRDKILKPFKTQFKLFFLCECGYHGDNKSHGVHRQKHRRSSMIHLAKHEGYDVENVGKFFEKYGPYIMTIMKILKIGLTVSGIAVPALAHLGEEMKSATQSFGSVSRNIGSLIDDSIKSLGTQIKGDNALVQRTTMASKMDFNDVRALEGVDLRQLASFLRNHDLENEFGNLTKTVSHDGHVQWVCNDHCHQGTRDSVLQSLLAYEQRLFLVKDGTIIYHGFIITSRTQAGELYGLMNDDRSDHDYNIQLEWKVTKDDLSEFSAAFTKTGRPVLRLYCPLVQKTGFGIFSSSIYNPIVQLMSNGHLTRMMIIIEDFYQHVSAFPLMMTSRLQQLVIHSTFSPNKRAHKSALKFILEHSPCLITLKTNTDDLWVPFDFMSHQATRFPNLQRITWETLSGSIAMVLPREGTQHEQPAIGMSIKQFDGSPDTEKILRNRHLTSLKIKRIDSLTGLSHLADALQISTKLKSVEADVDPGIIVHALESVVNSRKKAISERSLSTHWNALELSMICRRYPRCKGDKITLEFQENSSTFTISIELSNQVLSLSGLIQAVQSYPNRDDNYQSRFADKFAIALDNIIRESDSKVISLRIKTESLTLAGAEIMSRVIERSHNVCQLHLKVSRAYSKVEMEKARYLISRHSRSLHSLEIEDIFPYEWLLENFKLHPTRDDLPQLTSFILRDAGNNLNDLRDTHCSDDMRSGSSFNNAQWISRMVSAPLQLSASLHPLVSILVRDEPLTERVMNRSWQPLHTVELVGFTFQPVDWRLIIKAMDFSSLRQLSFKDSNFSFAEFDLLVDCIPESSIPTGRLTIHCDISDLARQKKMMWLERLRALQTKAPHVHVPSVSDMKYMYM
ncbi:hypothetical protein B0O80DRAFT_486331 [Mortierella sp. GBAus27b]|nr:hypothetical protein BGX31_006532 [Mortierella sp. GBA43]KAI8355775.1 hypothetical protein B0O80DRAFT_486331 [Mortierella sp. GBAus27b]